MSGAPPPPPSTPTTQVQALEALYAMAAGAGWRTSSNWMSGDPCNATRTWHGVSCFDGQVNQLCAPNPLDENEHDSLAD